MVTIQHIAISIYDSKHIFELLHNDRNVKGQSKQLEECLMPDHELVTLSDFEREVVKIMDWQSEALTVCEQNECSCLLKSKWSHLHPPGEDTISLEMVDSPRKFMNIKAEGQKYPTADPELDSKYINCSLLSPTSVIVETLFSHCSHVLMADCQCMKP